MIKLSKDNNFGINNKRTVEIFESDLEIELKSYFNWKTPTKRYNTIIERFYGLGSHKYDIFINHLISKGY